MTDITLAPNDLEKNNKFKRIVLEHCLNFQTIFSKFLFNLKYCNFDLGMNKFLLTSLVCIIQTFMLCINTTQNNTNVWMIPTSEILGRNLNGEEYRPLSRTMVFKFIDYNFMKYLLYIYTLSILGRALLSDRTKRLFSICS